MTESCVLPVTDSVLMYRKNWKWQVKKRSWIQFPRKCKM